MNARLSGTAIRVAGVSAMALGLLLLTELALAAFRFYFLTYRPTGLREDAPDDLLVFVFHVLFALTLATLYVALNRRVRLLGQIGLMMALVGTILFAAFGFFPVTVQEQVPPGGSFWPGVNGGVGPLLFGTGLALFGLAASGDRTVERSASLRAGAVMVLAGSVTPALWLLAVTLPYGQSLTVPLYGPVIVLVILFLPLGLVLLGVGLARLGWLLVQASKTRSAGGADGGGRASVGDRRPEAE